jgi:hypothetical protein
MKIFGIFPIVFGALDGKHIQLQAPFRNGGEYCKGTFSVVLLAATNATDSFFLGVRDRASLSSETKQMQQC